MPTLEVATGGTFARLRGGGGPASGGGIRGEIWGFSRASRKRMLDLLNQVEQGALSSGLFLGLTYPDLFPESAVRWKRDLDVFLKRARREYPGSVWIWRLEWKERLSGENVGKVAPHFHCLALGIPRLSLRWLSEAWHETVSKDCTIDGVKYPGVRDVRHLGAGTSAQRIRSRRGVLYYASKYMSKEAASPAFWTGRVWGIAGRELLPVVLVVVELTWEQFYKIRRVLRGWLERQRGKKAWGRGSWQGMSVYIDEGSSAQVLAWAVAG